MPRGSMTSRQGCVLGGQNSRGPLVSYTAKNVRVASMRMGGGTFCYCKTADKFYHKKTRPDVQFVGGDQDGFLLSAPPDKQHKENTSMTVLSMSV